MEISENNLISNVQLFSVLSVQKKVAHLSDVQDIKTLIKLTQFFQKCILLMSFFYH